VVAYDGNGNVSELGGSGDVEAHYEYDGFGNTASASAGNAETNAFGFSTKYAEQETGLVYFGYRSYWGGAGRWLNRDPIGEQNGPNVYAYLQNDTVDKIDPYGLQAQCAFGCGFNRGAIVDAFQWAEVMVMTTVAQTTYETWFGNCTDSATGATLTGKKLTQCLARAKRDIPIAAKRMRDILDKLRSNTITVDCCPDEKCSFNTGAYAEIGRNRIHVCSDAFWTSGGIPGTGNRPGQVNAAMNAVHETAHLVRIPGEVYYEWKALELARGNSQESDNPHYTRRHVAIDNAQNYAFAAGTYKSMWNDLQRVPQRPTDPNIQSHQPTFSP
jgi:RHS repeat-associated protein